MVKVVVLDDYPELIAFLAAPLAHAGHHVLQEAAPVDFEEIMQFQPQVVVAGVSRQRTALGRPGELAPEDVCGYQGIAAIRSYPAISLVPTLVVGVGLFEPEFPLTLGYDLFLTFPDDLEVYGPKVVELAQLVKTRRRISGYICPAPGCGSRLTYVKEPIRDLSCPKCGVGVALVDKTHGIWLDADGLSHAFLLEDLRAPVARRP